MMGTIHREGEERNLSFPRGAIQGNPGIGHQLLIDIGKDGRLLPLYSGIGATGAGKFQSRGEGRDGVEVLCSCFEFLRQGSEGGFFKTHGADHLTAAHIRRHGLQPLLLSIQHAGSGGGINLMSGENIEVAIQRLNVYGFVNYALRTIHQHRNTMTMANCHQILYRIYKA